MPPAIPAIAAVATTAAIGTGTVAVLGFTLTAATAGALVGGIAAVGMSLLTKPKSPNFTPLFDQPGGGRTFMVRQPTAPHRCILGRIKVSGIPAFMQSMIDDEGRADGYFYIQIALAFHQCRKIADCYVDDKLSTHAQFSGLVRFGKHLGTSDQVEDPDFLAELGSGVFGGHKGIGITNIAARLKGRAAAFPNGLPNLSAVVWGVVGAYDPRRGSRANPSAFRWTNNAALLFAWWKTWEFGQKVEWDDIDQATLIHSANVCDERIRTIGSTTGIADATTNAIALSTGARSLDVGDGVRLTSSGNLPSPLAVDTTYYVIPAEDETIRLATTVDNAFDESAIDLATAGTGTLTIHYWDEARYKLNGSFTLDQDKATIRDELLTAMMGFDVEVGGIWYIHAGAPTVATQTLDENDLRAGFAVLPKRSMRDKFNGIRARFVNPDNFWQPSEAPPYSDEGYVDEDNGISLFEEINLPFVTSARQVQRCQKIHLRRNRAQRTITLRAMYTAIPLRPLDGFYFSFERFNWEQVEHICIGWKLTEDHGVDLVAQEVPVGAYEWTAAEELAMTVPQGVTLPDPSVIGAPASVTVVTPTTPTFTEITLQWTAVLSVWLDGYDVEHRDAGTTDWYGFGRVGPGKEETDPLTVPITRATPQDFQVRAVTQNGTPGEFTQNIAPAEPSSVSATGGEEEIELEWTNGTGAAEIQIFVNSSATLEGATLLTTQPAGSSPQTYTHTGLGTAEAKHYVLRSVNTNGNISALTAFVSATTNA